MTIHFWTARFRDATTEAEFTPTQFDERRRRLGFLTWGLLALVGSHLISESWAGNSPAGRDSALGLQLQLLVLILGGGFLFYLRGWATQTQLPGLAIILVGMVILALAPPIAWAEATQILNHHLGLMRAKDDTVQHVKQALADA